MALRRSVSDQAVYMLYCGRDAMSKARYRVRPSSKRTLWMPTPPSFRSSATRDRSAGRARQGRSLLDHNAE
jgi:hypothetical protein